jgi:hypothetical protein
VEDVAAVERWLSATGASGLAVWPTGTDKSLLLSKISRLAVGEGRQVPVARHVAELVAHDATACERALGAAAVDGVSAGLVGPITDMSAHHPAFRQRRCREPRIPRDPAMIPAPFKVGDAFLWRWATVDDFIVRGQVHAIDESPYDRGTDAAKAATLRDASPK